MSQEGREPNGRAQRPPVAEPKKRGPKPKLAPDAPRGADGGNPVLPVRIPREYWDAVLDRGGAAWARELILAALAAQT